MTSPNDFPGAKRGDRLTADYLNRLIGRGRQQGRKGIAAGGVLQEPALTIPVVNTSSEDIPAYAPISLEAPVDTTDFGLFNSRAFNVVPLEDGTLSQLHGGIATDFIAAGKAGSAYVSGVCLAQLTNDNDGFLDAADIATLWQDATSGTRYAVVRIGGGVTESLIIPIGGQTLVTFNGITAYGVNRYSGTLASITTQTYDPGTVDATSGAETVAPSPAITAWPTGLGYGTRVTAAGYDRVIIVNDDRGALSTIMIGGASDDTTYTPSSRQSRLLFDRVALVTKADSTTVRAWVPKLG